MPAKTIIAITSKTYPNTKAYITFFIVSAKSGADKKVLCKLRLNALRQSAPDRLSLTKVTRPASRLDKA